MAICNKDCFNCPYDDCILDELSADDYKASREIDAAFLFPKTIKEKKIAAKQKAYYEANRDEIAAKQKAYREAKKKEKQNAVLQM